MLPRSIGTASFSRSSESLKKFFSTELQVDSEDAKRFPVKVIVDNHDEIVGGECENLAIATLKLQIVVQEGNVVKSEVVLAKG